MTEKLIDDSTVEPIGEFEISGDGTITYYTGAETGIVIPAGDSQNHDSSD